MESAERREAIPEGHTWKRGRVLENGGGSESTGEMPGEELAHPVTGPHFVSHDGGSGASLPLTQVNRSKVKKA